MDRTIRAHLLDVVRTLESRGRDDSRGVLLDALRSYAQRGRFPRWDQPIRGRYRPAHPRRFSAPGARAPRFRDPHGTWCAVGYLMSLTDEVLAKSLADRFEDHWLAEMDDTRIAAWARAHGFTIDELEWIQPGYCWQPPMCDDIAVVEAVYTETEPSCPGADPRPNPWATNGSWFCQDGCDGPFRVYLQVDNRGAAEAVGVDVRLWTPGSPEPTVLDSETVDIAARSATIVELQTASVLDLTNGGVEIIAPDSCTPGPQRDVIWDTGNGGVGWILPDECGQTCSVDTGPTASGGCGCSNTSSAPWMALPLVVLALRRSRPS